MVYKSFIYFMSWFYVTVDYILICDKGVFELKKMNWHAALRMGHGLTTSIRMFTQFNTLNPR